MQKLKSFFARLVANPKTSAAGIAGLVGIGFAAAAQPAILANPQVIVSIIGSIGLLVAADDNTPRPAQ